MSGCSLLRVGRALHWLAACFVVTVFMHGAAAQESANPVVKPALDAPIPESPQQQPALKPVPALPASSGVEDIHTVAPALPAEKQGQQPSGAAQVQTGSKIGEGTLANLASRLAALLGDHQFAEMEQLLNDSDAAASGAEGKLTSERAQLFHGLLSNRKNRPQESIRLLEPLLASLKTNTNPEEEKLLRKALAEDYLRAGEWAKAAQAYSTFAARMDSILTPDEKEEIELPLQLLPLAAANPPMTVEPGEPFALPYDRNALGLTDVPVYVDGRSHDWMLDPTLPFNLICRTTARDVGLKISQEAATVHTLTGRPIVVRATVIPRFTLGTITYRNMTAFVYEDADYYFPASKYQVRGVLGYPAISALGSVTITADARIEVQPGDKGERLAGGVPFYLDGDRILAELGGSSEDERAYVVDAGGQQTYLTSRYFAEHAGDFTEKKMKLMYPPGAGSRTGAPVPAFEGESVTLYVGGTAFTIHDVQILTEPLKNAAVDDTYGTLGIDALDELKSYTFDYRTMRFAVRSR